MDSVCNRNIISKLEKNLRIISDAFDFVNQLTEEDLKPLNDPDALFNSLTDNVRHALTAYLGSGKNINKLREIIKEYMKSHPEKKGNVLLPYKTELFEFSNEVDRIIKEADVQLNLICKTFSLNPPRTLVSAGDHYSIEAWLYKDDIKKNLQETFNIISAVKTVTEEP